MTEELRARPANGDAAIGTMTGPGPVDDGRESADRKGGSNMERSGLPPLAGVELGGTKCICILADGPVAIREKVTIPTTVPEETLPAILATLGGWYARHGFRALGLASFGPIELDTNHPVHGHIGATNKPLWEGADLLGPLKAAFPVPIALDTDVNGAALAEIRWGSGQGHADFAYVTVGTGVGVGLIVNGRPAGGYTHSEVGHIRVPRLPGDTVKSACSFHDDCVEGLASGPALHARLGGRPLSDVAPDDPVWEPIVATLAAMLHALVCATAPRRIAMGGGVISGQAHLLPAINAALEKSINRYMSLPDGGPYVVAPELGTMAGPLGAIALAIDAWESTEAIAD